jgi:hypothetical protein
LAVTKSSTVAISSSYCAERSNPLHGFGIDRSVEEIGRDFRPLATPT